MAPALWSCLAIYVHPFNVALTPIVSTLKLELKFSTIIQIVTDMPSRESCGFPVQTFARTLKRALCSPSTHILPHPLKLETIVE